MSDTVEPEAQDVDPIETKEWVDSLNSIVKYDSVARAGFVLEQLRVRANALGIPAASEIQTPYLNTIPTQQEEKMPDDGAVLSKLIAYLRWNVMAMVMRANNIDSSIGGHIASYGGFAELFEVALTYFLRATNDKQAGDLAYFQGHSAEGIYARAFLEGRITEKHLENFRRECFTDGLSSYPHPHLMPDFWQFPTVSLGIGPLLTIYQAQMLRYLEHRGLAKTEGRKVWGFWGDGELNEVDSLGGLLVAGREKLDNLIHVVSCNLQRLDGPVWGNGQIIQEYESVYRGAGWNVIKIVWGEEWVKLIEKDKTGLLRKRIDELVDGEYQSYSAKGGAYLREHFFGKYPELLSLVEDKNDDELGAMLDGGHDLQKVFAAYAAAVKHKGQPTVILAKTIKGFGMGKSGKGLNTAHNTHKVAPDALKEFCERYDLPLTDKQINELAFVKPKKDSPEIKYLQKQRKDLGGYLPEGIAKSSALEVPALSDFQKILDGFGDKQLSSNMAFVRTLNILFKHKGIKKHLVPIVSDEARTLGLEGLFPQIGIYAPLGQKYTPEDSDKLVNYRESKTGQFMQQGITEAGCLSTWICAGTSYASTGVPMIPFFIYYSMFGYQRVGDYIWAACDAKARGFLIGGTAGRTTLAGEGLQHQDGHNLLAFSFMPSCRAYDPTFAYEIAVIVQRGLEEMYKEQKDVFYYMTMMNENYEHPAMPKGCEEGIVKGLYLFSKGKSQAKLKVQLMGSGTILREAIAAAELLQKEFNVSADVWSATSFNELARDMRSIERHNRLNPDKKAKSCYVETVMAGHEGPVIAATDYIKLYAEQIRPAISSSYHVLGTDGFGRSDVRSNLRDFFEVDARMIAYTALKALADDGKLSMKDVVAAKKKLKIDGSRPDPITQ